MPPYPHRLVRSIVIQASRATVFRFFTDDARWAAWWGAGSTIQARPGGRMTIRHPNGIELAGEVLEVSPPERIVFSYGFATGKPIPPGGSRVTIRLEPFGRGTRLHLEHEFEEAAVRDEHVQGWRYQLALFANVVCDEVHAHADEAVDAWLGAWSEPDAEKREGTLARVASPDVQFRDRFSLVEGLPDLLPHLAAVHRFMPGVRLRRQGDVRHCQGTVLADWVALGADGRERGHGTSVFLFGPEGRIEAVTGLWAKAPGA